MEKLTKENIKVGMLVDMYKKATRTKKATISNLSGCAYAVVCGVHRNSEYHYYLNWIRTNGEYYAGDYYDLRSYDFIPHDTAPDGHDVAIELSSDKAVEIYNGTIEVCVDTLIEYDVSDAALEALCNLRKEVTESKGAVQII